MWQLKKAASYETAKGLSDRSHDIPTRKRIITCASSDMQQPIIGMEGQAMQSGGKKRWHFKKVMA